jgi:hypothetical protein
VSVKLAAFALALPTFNLAFWRRMSVKFSVLRFGEFTWKSFFFSFFFLLLEPILIL